MAPALLQAAALALRATVACPASPTCPTDDQCTYTANKASFIVSCDTDYYGGDLQLAQTSTLTSCMNACSKTASCVAASYVGGNCYMKSTLNAANANVNVIGVAVTSVDTSTGTSPATGICPSSFTCPENDGCSYTDGSRTLSLSCGKDFYGGDLLSQYAVSLEACTQACAANADCVAASFVGGKGPGTCYLKNIKNGGNINDNVDAVYVVTVSASPSSSAPATSTLDATSMTPASSTTLTSSTTPVSSTVPLPTSSEMISSTLSPSLSSSMSSSTPPLSTSTLDPAFTMTSTINIVTSVSSSTQVMSSFTASSDTASSAASTPLIVASPSSSPTPVSVVVDGGFEATDSIPWTVKLNVPTFISYNLADTASSHSGGQAASITYTAGRNNAYQAWFNQPINLQPNTRYNLSAWYRASTSNPNCYLYFYIGSADGSQVVKILSTTTPANVKTEWAQVTAIYDSGTAGALTFNVRTTCSTTTQGRTYYIDDISFAPA